MSLTMVSNANTGFLTGLLAERIRRELSSAFGVEFSLSGDAPHFSGINGEIEDLSHTVREGSIFSTLRYPGPNVVRVHGVGRVLVVPIAQNGSVVAVATATFEHVNSPRQLVQMANLVLDKVQARDEIEWLRQQNEEHLIQATQDLEEMTFLRSIAGHLEVTDSSRGMWGLAQVMLPSLLHSIRAEKVLFVGAVTTGDGQVMPAPPLLQFGDDQLSEESCLELIEYLQPRANFETVVKNRMRTSAFPMAAAIRNLILVPLNKGDRTLAWLLAINRRDIGNGGEDIRWALSQHEFGTNEASLCESAASILATHEVNVGLVRDKERFVANVVRTLVTTIEAKDPYTRGHSDRVALFAKCLGNAMQLSSKICERLYLTGLVHDVGKIGVSDAILKKVGTLTDEEFEEIKKHPDAGWAILRDLEQIAYVLPGVLYHHERYDGKGYPDGLAGEEIPLDGRIIAVADAYDAMTSDRAYRHGLSQEKAEAVLRDGAGTQWDPRIIDAFFQVRDEIVDLRRFYSPPDRPGRQPRSLKAVGEELELLGEHGSR